MSEPHSPIPNPSVPNHQDKNPQENQPKPRSQDKKPPEPEKLIHVHLILQGGRLWMAFEPQANALVMSKRQAVDLGNAILSRAAQL